MKKITKILIAFLTIASATYAGCPDAQLAPYFETQAALANDDLADAQAAAKKLHTAAESSGCSVDGEGCCSTEISAAADIAGAKDIASARQAFKVWSDSLLAKIEDLGIEDGHAYKMHCPMAFNNSGADWIQNNTDLRNPYYGSMMLKCGTVQKEISGTDHSHHNHAH